MTELRDFPERFMIARKRKGLEHWFIAEALGVSHSTPWRWETGRTKPSYDVIQDLAELLDVDAAWLAWGKHD